MARPTLQNGDTWSDDLANASINPQVGDQDEPGFFAPLLDTGLSNAPGNLKKNFYGWFERLQLTATGGLLVTYQGCPVRLPGGFLATLSAGSLFLPDNSAGFLFIRATGANTVALEASMALPLESLPLYQYTTSGGAIGTLRDIREQAVAVIAPQALPAATQPFLPGDTKWSFRSSPEAGWVLCQGQSLSKTLYPALFEALGYSYGGSGDSFRLPDGRGRLLGVAGAGAGISPRNLGDAIGKETATIGIQNLPSHSHAVQEEPHGHGFAAGDHTHILRDAGHTHSINDRGHNHRTYADAKGALIPVLDTSQTGAETSSRGGGNATFTTRSDSNLSINAASSGLTLENARAEGAVRPSTTGIQVSPNGGDQPINITPPSVFGNLFIKL